MSWISPTASDYGSEYYDDALKKINSLYDGLQLKNSSASDLYKEGRGIASSAAGDKAAIAKKQAKASAMQNGAGRMTAAVQGAGAASNAVNEGFDSNVSTGMGAAQTQEQNSNTNELTKANAKSSALLSTAEGKARAKTNAKNARENRSLSTLGTFASLLGGNNNA